MRFGKLGLCLLLCASPAVAFSPEAPVAALVNATVDNWSGEKEEFQFVLSDASLSANYSQAFVKAYRDAAKKMSDEFADGEQYEPFGYDIITNSQDGCPLQDVKTSVSKSESARAELTVSFKHFACMGDQAEYQARNVVYFDVIEEGGRAVVDDVRHKTDEGIQSLRAELADILKAQ